ncbi:MAG: porin family protein [Candidatus Aminicenantes bacterium]|nr:porin family protein [Candidatus Aminicenantes bacterium]
MKKGLLVFSVALLLAALVPQAVAAAVDIDLGVKGGVSLAKLKWSDDTEASSNLTQPVFGVFAAFNLNKSFAIQPEIYLLTQGGTFSSEAEIGILESVDLFEYKSFYRYIHVPILAKVRLMPNEKLNPIIFAGPAVDFLLSAHDKYYINGVFEGDEDVKQDLKTTNFGLVFGAGVEYMMDKVMLILDVRYDMGLADINAVTMGSYTLKTKTLMFMAGVGF